MKDRIKIGFLKGTNWIPEKAKGLEIWFILLFCLIIGSTVLSLVKENYIFLSVPVLLLFGYLVLVDTKAIFALLWFSIPISTEVLLPGGFGTDLPSEPLMIAMMGLGFLLILQSPRNFPYYILKHPLTLLIILHVGWITLSTITSDNMVVSVKFLLAKIWYIAAFFFVTFLFIRNIKDLERWIWYVLVPLIGTIVFVMIRHAFKGLTFATIGEVISPFYRNHVSYACLLVIFLPYVIYKWKNITNNIFLKRSLLASIGLILIATYFSYTRAAYVCIVLMAGVYFLIQFRLIKLGILVSLIGGAVFLSHMIQRNTYTEYAPNFEKTIAHYDFDDLVSATYKMQDASTMERFYRWIGGFYMIKEKPLLGFGPGNFFNFYKSYIDRSFRTYVSANPENSGVHNYYLMVTVEQGIPGIVIFLILVGYFLIRGENLYHELGKGKERELVLCGILSISSILFILLLNDMIETDKLGSIFFINFAILVGIDTGFLRGKEERLKKNNSNVT